MSDQLAELVELLREYFNRLDLYHKRVSLGSQVDLTMAEKRLRAWFSDYDAREEVRATPAITGTDRTGEGGMASR